MGQLNTTVAEVTQRIIERSSSLRADYLRQIKRRSQQPSRARKTQLRQPCPRVCGLW